MALKNESVNEIINAAVEGVVARLLPDIRAAMQQARAPARVPRRASKTPRRRRKRQDITRWVADVHARRVPNFVIDLTGLDTKKKIVAKFGAGAVFEKGKALPPAGAHNGVKNAPSASAARVVAARPPSVRKAASA